MMKGFGKKKIGSFDVKRWTLDDVITPCGYPMKMDGCVQGWV